MKKVKEEKHTQHNTEETIIAADARLMKSPLAGLTNEVPRIHMDNSYPMAKEDWGYVTSRGHLYMNPNKEGAVGEWAFVLAHCMLHLGMGHFLDNRMDDPA